MNHPHLSTTAVLELVIEGMTPPHRCHWLGDDTPFGPKFLCDDSALRRLKEVRLAFQSLFERNGRPLVEAENLRAMGTVLYDTFFQPGASARTAANGTGPNLLLLRAAAPAFLNLPWELVWLPGASVPLGCDPAWAVLRVPVLTTTNATAPPDPGPLRLLFLAAAPEGPVPLDYEREEEALLNATARLDRNVVILPFAETGGIGELADLVTRHRPQVVHLTGHGVTDAEGTGWFVFEDERGRSAPEAAGQIVSRVFRGSAVRCVVLNGCQTGQAAAAGLAGQLVTNGTPLVLGWGASVLDDTATNFNAAFYRFLAAGDRVPAATAKARLEVWNTRRTKHGEHELWDATFALPWLFSCGPDADLIDRAVPPQHYEGPKTERMILDDDIKGLREGFVGRRREQQRLIPPLLDGCRTVAVLTGIGGMGKSTLATRVAGRLREAGFEISGIKASRGTNPAEAGRLFLVEKLLPALARPFLVQDRPIYNAIRDGQVPVEDRVALAVAEWKKRRLVLVIDNFEDVLDESRTITDPGLRTAYRLLTRNLTEGSRLLVTCRYFPADTPDPDETSHLLWRDLKDLKEFELVKFLRREKATEARMRAGVITLALIQKVHRAFGGSPGFLVQARALLGHADLDGWEDEIPDDTPLEEARQHYCEQIMIPRLYGLLASAAQSLASRLAVSELPLPADGLARVAELSEVEAVTAAETAANYGIVQVFAEPGKPTLYHVPGLIRTWLMAPERFSEEAHKAVDASLAKFWKESLESNRANELQVSIDMGLHSCRTHAGQAGRIEEFRWATKKLVVRLYNLAEWKVARALLNEIREQDRDGPIWNNLAIIDLREGDPVAAREMFGRALLAFRVVDDRAGESTTWHNLATIDLEEGNHTAAREKFAKALLMRQAVGDRAGEAVTWHNLASIDLNELDLMAALEKFGKALAISQSVGDLAGEAATWHGLASIDLEKREFASARDKFGKALAMRQAVGDRAGEGATWHQLGTLDLNEGNHAGARDKFGKALAIRQTIGDRYGEGGTWHQLATTDVNEGDFAAAREKFGKAFALRHLIGDRAGEATTWHQLACLAYVSCPGMDAVRLAAVSFLIYQAIGHSKTESASQILSAWCAKLRFPQNHIPELLKSVAESYQRDRGASLLKAAFPE